MGMDVYGEAPAAQAGEYFRNNCWWWRPLWDYACQVAKIDKKLHEAGHYNDGVLVDGPTSVLIADILDEEVASGRTAEYYKRYQAELDAMADEQCVYCDGTGDRADLGPPEWKKECNACHGKGSRRPSATWYGFDVDNVKEFAVFARASGGFRIS